MTIQDQLHQAELGQSTSAHQNPEYPTFTSPALCGAGRLLLAQWREWPGRINPANYIAAVVSIVTAHTVTEDVYICWSDPAHAG